MRNLVVSLFLLMAFTNAASAQTLAEVIKKNPGRSPEWIAETSKQPLADVTKQLVAAYRVPIAPSKFDEVWLKLTEWENPLLITIVGGSVIEVHSKIPKGNYDQGFFNLEHTAQLTGHFKVENIKAIYMVEEPSRGGDVQRQVAFYDADGKRIFGVFVDRNESGGKHYPGTLKQYQAMMDFYKAQALK